MSSPFWSALGKLDGSVHTIQSQIDCLRAALEIDDAKLSQSLMQARREGALLRDLIRAERPDAKWNDRTELDMLIHDLEIAAQERRNQATPKQVDGSCQRTGCGKGQAPFRSSQQCSERIAFGRGEGVKKRSSRCAAGKRAARSGCRRVVALGLQSAGGKGQPGTRKSEPGFRCRGTFHRGDGGKLLGSWRARQLFELPDPKGM